MTALGVPTAQASTQIRSALIELQKPSATLAKAMSDAGLSASTMTKTLKEQGLTATLQQLQVSAAKSGLSLTQIFGSAESASAGLLLTGENAERAIDTLEGVRLEIERGVSTEAYNVAADSIDVKTKLIGNQIQAIFSSVFDSLGSGAVTAIQSVNQVAPALAGLGGVAAIIPPGFGKTIADSSKNIIGKLVPSLITTSATSGATAISFSTMWAALTGPIGLAIAGIAAVGAILYFLGDALVETNEEKLESAKADEEMIAGQKKVNEAEQNSLKSKQDLIDKYKELSSKSELTAFEQQKLKDTIVQLNEIYPDAINSTKSFEENLKSLNQASAEDTQRLSELAEQMKKLDEDSKVATIKRVELETVVSADSLKENLLDEVDNFLGGNSQKQVKAVDEYVDSIKNAANPEEANRALLAFNTALWNNPMFDEVPPDAKKAMAEQAKGLVDTRTAELEEKSSQATERINKALNDAFESGVTDLSQLSTDQKAQIEIDMKTSGKSQSDIEKIFDDLEKNARDLKLGEIISESTQVNSDLKGAQSLDTLVESFKNAETEIEKAALGKLISNIAPEAVSATGKIKDANGDLVTSYALLEGKVEESKNKQLELNSAKLDGNQGKFFEAIDEEGKKIQENTASMEKLQAQISEKTKLGVDTSDLETQYKKLKSENDSYTKDVVGIAEKWIGAGLSSEEMLKKVADATGLSVEESAKLVKNMQDTKTAVEDTEEAVKSLGDQFSEDLSGKSAEFKNNLSELTGLDRERQRARASGDKQAIKDAERNYQAQLKITKEANNELKTLEKTKTANEDIFKEKKVKGETEYQRAQKLFKAEEERINLSKELFTIEQENNIAVNERQKTTEDDLILSQKNLQSIEEKKQKLIELYKITQDSKGDLSFGIKLKTDEKAEISNQLTKLNNEIAKEETSKIKLNTTLKIQDDELNKKILEQERKQLEYNVEIGITPRIDLAKAIDKDLDDVTSKIEEKEIKINILKTSSNLSDEQKIELKKLETDVIEHENKKIELTKSSKTQYQTIYDEELTVLKAKHSTELSEVEDRIEQERALRSTLIESTNTLASSNEEAEFEKKMQNLESLKEAELISEGNFNKKKEDLELEHQHRMQVIQEMSLGSQLEADRQADLEKLNQKKAQLVEELAIEQKKAEISGDRKRFDELSTAISTLESDIANKGDIITSLAGNLQGNITEIFSSLTGNEEQMKEPWRKAFSVIAGALKELASTAITNLILGQLNITAGATGLASILLIPAIKGLANAGVNALLSPILSGLLSFSTGGRVDQPTLAWVGDASNSRPGADTEWIFRDDQIKYIMRKVVSDYHEKLVSVINNSDKVNIKELNKQILSSYIHVFSKASESETINKTKSIAQSILLNKMQENDVNLVRLFSDVVDETKVIKREIKFNKEHQNFINNEYLKSTDINYYKEFKTDYFVESMKRVTDEIQTMKVLFKENQFTAENINDFVKNYTKITTAQKHYMNDEIVEREYRETIHQSVVNVKSYANGSLFLDTPELAIIGDAGVNNPEIVLNLEQIQDIIKQSAEYTTKGINSKLDEVIEVLERIDGSVVDSGITDDSLSKALKRINFNKNKSNRVS